VLSFAWKTYKSSMYSWPFWLASGASRWWDIAISFHKAWWPSCV
jgi:hypothetical protein